jgi:hypothetical protein
MALKWDNFVYRNAYISMAALQSSVNPLFYDSLFDLPPRGRTPHYQAAIHPAVMFASPFTFLYIFHVWT